MSNSPLDSSLLALVHADDAGEISYTLPDVYEPLVAAGLVEINPGMTTGDGCLGTRPTMAGRVRAAGLG